MKTFEELKALQRGGKRVTLVWSFTVEASPAQLDNAIYLEKEDTGVEGVNMFFFPGWNKDVRLPGHFDGKVVEFCAEDPSDAVEAEMCLRQMHGFKTTAIKTLYRVEDRDLTFRIDAETEDFVTSSPEERKNLKFELKKRRLSKRASDHLR